MNDRSVPPEVTREATAAGLSARFGVPVWWGNATRRWWALLPGGRRGRLVEAATPYELAVAIGQAREDQEALRRSGDRGRPVTW